MAPAASTQYVGCLWEPHLWGAVEGKSTERGKQGELPKRNGTPEVCRNMAIMLRL